MAKSVVSAVLSNVSTLAVQETTLLCGVTREVEFLKDDLNSLQGFLRDADNKQRMGDSGVSILVSQIRDAAYEADNVIEAVEYMHRRNRLKKGFMGAISRYARLPTDLSTLHKVGFEIKRIRRKISEIFERANRLKIVLDLSHTSIEKIDVDDELQQDYGPIHQKFEDVVMVGFEDEYKEIVGKLVDTKKSLGAISIVAMGGAGKITLARKVYTSSRVKQHFGTIAWVTVSQKYKGIDLLKDIMKQIMGDTDESTSKLSEHEVGQKIHDFLLQTRYLVVLDDVWETDTWEQLNRKVKAFPDATNGSRVLLTTRKEDVANHVQMATYIHHLKKLDEKKSWEIFSSKALPPYKMSVICDVDEFEKLGRKLAKKCDGLPLALAVLGGYLSKNLNVEAWSNILLDWPSTKDGQMMRVILARSYKDLPNHYLRSCFLYFAGFPEDYIISVSDLIELWIGESFIPHIRNHQLEETAHKYVKELAQRSLVQVVGVSTVHGRIEAIRIHDILHDWCIEEAKQDGFLCAIDKTAGHAYTPSSDNIISYRYQFQTLSGDILTTTPNARSLLGFDATVSLPELRFLRVLCIEESKLQDFSSLIGGCIHLRLLRLKNCGPITLPSSIGNLLYLQTIDVRDTPLLGHVPKSLWGISTLRHVYLHGAWFSPPPPTSSVRRQQKELQTIDLNLGNVITNFHNHDMVVFFSQMNQLTNFSLSKNHIPKELICIFANMPHLVDIYLSKFGVLDNFPTEFPQSLRRLVLCANVIIEDPMPSLEKLPCLVVLELRGYNGETMSCCVEGFPRLQELKLVDFLTAEWRMEDGAMPKLFHLTLQECEKLRKLPEGLLHLPSLSHLELGAMPQISEEDITLKGLWRKGCMVRTHATSV
ncbi:hypothetical protein CFC21_106294 [Triticum aestivum]|uniref:NB-ARC domain-containing protein n=2 Tax=Triticum aestivum TaxID=4565 RepID=A0A9R1MDW3_WHEAT|nr:hypothetical protein CFC21_106294 [Triticum aestivum]